MAADEKKIAGAPPDRIGPKIFVGAAALFFFVSIIKFGTPVILDNYLQPPENAAEALFDSWRINWGYIFLSILCLTALPAIRWKSPGFRCWLALPLAWLGWQFVSAQTTVDPELTRMTLKYFSACVILFCLGWFAMRDVRATWPIWAGLGLALCWVMRSGFEQHFGGLAATRQYVYSLKDATGLPPAVLSDPAYLRRIAGNRIFGTFSNPDAFAGLIELLLPAVLVFVWQVIPKVRAPARWLIIGILGGAGLACLYWSGSKAGWLVVIIMGMVALGHSPMPAQWKRGLIAIVLVLGVAEFAVKYSANFHKQNNSVDTRFTYWRAALTTVERHPLVGSGPGTFSIPYGQLLKPGDEPTKLCHNDYLEQASDSGLPGFLIYSAMIIGFLAYLYRYRIKKQVFNINLMVWLGLAGLCLHSLVEYHLYIPALAWPMFFLFGWRMNCDN